MTDQKSADNIVRTGDGQVVVPMGTQPAGSGIPKDTLPRPTPRVGMPDTTQPAVQQETVPQRAVESTTTFDELAVKKGFRSPEDLAKAYKELEQRTSRSEAVLSEVIRSRMEGSFEQPQSTPKVEEVNSPEDALRIVDQRVQKQVKPLQDRLEYEIYLVTHPDEKQFSSEALRIAKDNPGVSWEIAFKAAKADSLASTERERGKQEAYQSIQNKQDAQLPSGAGGGSRMPEPTIREIQEGIAAGKIPLSEARRFINSLSQ